MMMATTMATITMVREEEEEWDEELSTEVLVLRIHQAWVSKETWAMWKPNADREEVARTWLRRQELEAWVEDVFHPRMYGAEPFATATLSLRVEREHREDFLHSAGIEDGIPKPLAEPTEPEIVWLGAVQPSVENMKRVMRKVEAIQGHRGVVMNDRGPGVRVWPEEFSRKARELLDVVGL